jgi:hypothetical protein
MECSVSVRRAASRKQKNAEKAGFSRFRSSETIFLREGFLGNSPEKKNTNSKKLAQNGYFKSSLILWVTTQTQLLKPKKKNFFF